MTVSTTTRVIRHIGNGVTTSFPYDFVIPDANSARVELETISTGARTLLAASAYSITGLGDTAGGSVTYPLAGAAMEDDEALVVYREVPYTQDLDITNQDGFHPESVEEQLDKIVYQTQQLADESDRSLKFPIAYSGSGTELPSAASRANKAFWFDADGEPVMMASGADVVPPVYRERNAINAASIAENSDGYVGWMAGLPYKVDSTAIGTASATDDLSVSGLVPFGPAFPEHFGAAADGLTDVSTAFQAAIDHAETVGGMVAGTPGATYMAGGLTIDADHVRIRMPHSKILNSGTSDLFTLGGTALTRFCEITVGEIENESTAGHVLVAGESFAVTDLTWNVREVFQRATAKSILKATFAGAGGIFDSRFFGGYWWATSAQSVPLVKVSADSGRFAANVFRINRITPNAGALAVRPFDFECTSASTYLFTNIIEETNFEVCDAGVIRLAGCRNWTLRDLWSFDNGDAISADMILLTNDGASGLDCEAIVIEGYTRTQGAFSGASYDIHLENANDTYVRSGDGDGGIGLLINCNANNCTISDPGAHFTLTNFAIGNSTLLQSGEGKGLTTDTVEAQKIIFSKSVELTIAAGAITATGSYHAVDTEADAATDDLVTINGGTTGMRLVLAAANDARTIVLKDSTGNLVLAGDCSLTSVGDTIELIFNGANWLELSRSDNGV